MGNLRLLIAAFLFSCMLAPAAWAQQPNVTIDGDNITLTGCVVPAGQNVISPSMLIWSRGEIMLAGVSAAAEAPVNAVGTGGVSGRVFYWLDDGEDLRKHIGQRVEIKGDLEDFEEGEIRVERDGGFTEIELDIDGHEEKVRVPTAWLGAAPDDAEFTIVAREVDVDDIRVLGPCGY
jgi:hypothetical protein